MSTGAEKPRKASNQVAKTCELFRLLAGHEVQGLAPGEIAKALDVMPSWVSQNLPALATIGFIEKVGHTNRWRLGVAFVRIAFTVFTANSTAKEQLDERIRRISTPLMGSGELPRDSLATRMARYDPPAGD